MVLIRFR